ncbi:histidine phosphatase family protein [Myxococcus sp. K38C18041901]|uniref:histidine phosphatase family protein n=1 Tax=Myxococcus guangdongensis TaxID=2906760 RepID=UPI0020A70429|nr:histidine phosphatase family protein [Myxococcus guangdongensis]MCP3062207.1 histidine phosphatase family protein [Myxococcus guangdongensis]
MKMRGPQVVLVRHGETAWSRGGQHTGRTDVPLLEDGRKMAAKLGEPLRAWDFAQVWTSPLSRAFETCALAGYGEGAVRRDDLMEWDYGDHEGRTGAEIRVEHPGWTVWKDGVPNGETAEHVGARADHVIADLRQQTGDILLFSHGHFLRVLAARWLGLVPSDGRLFLLSTGSISVLGADGPDAAQPALAGWNDTTHLKP